MSVTSGVVSRIEVTSYVHGAAELLGIQIDAAVSDGSVPDTDSAELCVFLRASGAQVVHARPKAWPPGCLCTVAQPKPSYYPSLYPFLLIVKLQINSGNSGGPAFNCEGECCGVAFQSLKHEDAENVGYIIPTPVVQHFINDYERNGCYTGFPTVGIEWQKLESLDLRLALKMRTEQKGVMVRRIEPTTACSKVSFRSTGVPLLRLVSVCLVGSYPVYHCITFWLKSFEHRVLWPCSHDLNFAKHCGDALALVYLLRTQVLQQYDVLLSFDGVNIANDGTVPFRTGERIAFSYLVSQKYTNDIATLGILHQGKQKTVTVKLQVGRRLASGDTICTNLRSIIIGGPFYVSSPQLRGLT